jgi:Ca2+-binding RTX toxin-like protein
MVRMKLNLKLKLWAGVALLTAMTTTSAWAIDLSGSEWDFAQLVQTTCFNQPATSGVTLVNGVLTGTEGNDVIIGTSRADVIDGKGGNDLLCGAGGADRIFGGFGDDMISGGPGSDPKLDGQGGNDRIEGGTDSEYGCGCSGCGQLRTDRQRAVRIATRS